MKKILFGLMVLVVGLALASTASAMKLTSKGYMDVSGIYLGNDITDPDDNNDNASWYQQELIVDPTLHITDKVKIHGRITVLERNWWGDDERGVRAYGINAFNNNSAQAGGLVVGYRGEAGGGNNWWVEQCWMSFPLLGGSLHVGRMPGGYWAYPFADWQDNRDRIKYVRKVGKYVLVGVVGQRNDLDAQADPLLGQDQDTAITGQAIDTAADDEVLYGVGGILPFSKNFIVKQLIFLQNFQGPLFPNKGFDVWCSMTGIGLQAGPVKVDSEIDLFYYDAEDAALAGGKDWDGISWQAWAEGAFKAGPAEIALGGFWIVGSEYDDDADDAKFTVGVGGEFEPYFLFFSEDVGLLFAGSGVGSANPNPLANSGFISAYGRVGFNITDNMKLGATVGWLRSDEKAGAGLDKDLGWEVDAKFQWNFYENISYVVDAGYIMAGDYWDDVSGGEEEDPWGLRHQLVITW